MRRFELQGERGDAITHLGVLPAERVRLDLAERAQVQQPVLLRAGRMATSDTSIASTPLPLMSCVSMPFSSKVLSSVPSGFRTRFY
jgi:hypothetical protein